MLQSKLFTRTERFAPKDEEALNAQLLSRAGYVDKLMAGVYSYLPLGLRVLRKVEQIDREEMNAVGGQEVLMPMLHPKAIWETTGSYSVATLRSFSHMSTSSAFPACKITLGASTTISPFEGDWKKTNGAFVPLFIPTLRL